MTSFILYGMNRVGESPRYIGITSAALKKRLQAHYQKISKDHKGNWVAKAKLDNVKLEIVPYCVGLTKEEAGHLEREIIAGLRKIGFDLVNTSLGGTAPMFGRKHSQESRKKISAGNRGKTVSDEVRKKISIGHTGKKLSEAHKEAINRNRKGRPLSLEHRRAISESLVGRIFSDEHKHKLSLASIIREAKKKDEV